MRDACKGLARAVSVSVGHTPAHAHSGDMHGTTITCQHMLFAHALGYSTDILHKLCPGDVSHVHNRPHRPQVPWAHSGDTSHTACSKHTGSARAYTHTAHIVPRLPMRAQGCRAHPMSLHGPASSLTATLTIPEFANRLSNSQLFFSMQNYHGSPASLLQLQKKFWSLLTHYPMMMGNKYGHGKCCPVLSAPGLCNSVLVSNWHSLRSKAPSLPQKQGSLGTNTPSELRLGTNIPRTQGSFLSQRAVRGRHQCQGGSDTQPRVSHLCQPRFPLPPHQPRHLPRSNFSLQSLGQRKHQVRPPTSK